MSYKMSPERVARRQKTLKKLEGVMSPEPTFKDWDAKQDEYYKDRYELLKSGDPTWMVRNFDSDNGKVYDLFIARQLVGLVHHDYERGCSVDVIGDPTRFRDRLELSDAVELLENHFGI